MTCSGLRLALQLDDFWVLKLPDGSKVEIFGPDSPTNRHFTTGPVAGFLVDDVFGATEELRSAGVEILLEPVVDDSGNVGSTSELRMATSTSSPRIPE